MVFGKLTTMIFNFFTDGAYSPTRNQGGWAYYCPELHLRVCGEQIETTNNRMELTAVIKALEFIIDSNLEVKEIFDEWGNKVDQAPHAMQKLFIPCSKAIKVGSFFRRKR